MIVKRPIYDQQLKCVAFEILNSKKEALSEAVSITLRQLIGTSDPQLPLFLPFEFKNFIEHFEEPPENPIILKLAAQDINTIYPAEEIKECSFSIALLINTPQHLTWLNYADYIALTEELMQAADVTKVVQFSRAKQRKVIAYGLLQPLNFDKCKTMSIDYYCGEFLFKPVVDDQTEIAANKLNLLQLIQSLQKEDCDMQKIAPIINTDPLLSYQLLRLANSAAFFGGNPVTSIDHAVTRLGLINLKNWVTLFSMKNISDKPIEILESGLIRAHMTHELAKKDPKINKDSAYTAGLLSILDCLMNKTLPELLKKISLPEDVTLALNDQTGPLGELLSSVIAYETGNWDEVGQDSINGIDLSQLYIETLTHISQGEAMAV
jgi:c-di-GMP-related signal transduction protein